MENSENESFKEKLMKYLNETMELQYNPTFKDIEKNLVKQEAQKIELKDVLAMQFNKNKIKFIYDDTYQVYRISKIKFNKNIIFLISFIVSIFCMILFFITLFYPPSWLSFYWTFVFLFPLFFLRFKSLIDRNKKRKILADFNNSIEN